MGTVKLEEQLKALKDLGIRLRRGMTVDHVLVSFPREDYEKRPFELLLTTMGSELEVEPYERLSDDVWHFDAECIEDHGAYVDIAERVAVLAGLELGDVKDYVRADADEAWLAFTLDGVRHKWDLEVEDDWADESVFEKFDALLQASGDQRLITLQWGGQDCLILAGNAERLQRLRETTGLDFHWMCE